MSNKEIKLGEQEHIFIPNSQFTSSVAEVLSSFDSVDDSPKPYLGESYNPNQSSSQCNIVSEHVRLREQAILDTATKLNQNMSRYAILRFVHNSESGSFEVRVIAMANDLSWIVANMEDNDNVFQMH